MARTAAKPSRKPAPVPAAKPGRAEHVPDDKTRTRVTAWAAGGIEQTMIAMSLGISRPTLVKHYKAQLAIGKATVDGIAVSALVRAMQGGGKEAVTAAKWWTGSRMGWSERVILDDGKPTDVPMRVIVELVGEAPAAEQGRGQESRRAGFDGSNLVQLVG